MIKIAEGPEYTGETYIWCSVHSPDFDGQNYHYNGETEGIYSGDTLSSLRKFIDKHNSCSEVATSPGDFKELISLLRSIKQELFNESVEGNGRQPVDVVNSVCFRILPVLKTLPKFDQQKFYREVLDFYPDYEPEVP